MGPEQTVGQLSKTVFHMRIADCANLARIIGRETEADGEAGTVFVTKTGKDATFHRVFVIKRRGIAAQLPDCLHFLVAFEELILKPAT